VRTEVGRGSFGTTYLGKWEEKKVVIKVGHDGCDKVNFVEKHKTLTTLPPHSNVISIFHITTYQKKPTVIVEYCDGRMFHFHFLKLFLMCFVFCFLYLFDELN
jgi:serine/threonine protein kinase